MSFDVQKFRANPPRESTLSLDWLISMAERNQPQELPNGTLLSGLARIAHVYVFEKDTGGKNKNFGDDDGNSEGKYHLKLLWPAGTDMSVFDAVWNRLARAAFPNNWTPEGKPNGLHSPFHDQADKVYGAKPYVGYVPGAIYMDASSQYQPIVVHGSDLKTQILDKNKVYSGQWAIASLRPYHYANRKTGVGFGLNQVVIVADDKRLITFGGGDPVKTFAGVQITAQSNIAAKFDQVPAQQQGAPAASVMPSGSHVGTQGTMAVTPLPGADPWD